MVIEPQRPRRPLELHRARAASARAPAAQRHGELSAPSASNINTTFSSGTRRTSPAAPTRPRRPYCDGEAGDRRLQPAAKRLDRADRRSDLELLVEAGAKPAGTMVRLNTETPAARLIVSQSCRCTFHWKSNCSGPTSIRPTSIALISGSASADSQQADLCSRWSSCSQIWPRVAEVLRAHRQMKMSNHPTSSHLEVQPPTVCRSFAELPHSSPAWTSAVARRVRVGRYSVSHACTKFSARRPFQ